MSSADYLLKIGFALLPALPLASFWLYNRYMWSEVSCWLRYITYLLEAQST